MKKFLESRYALGMSLSAIIIASLFIPGIWGKVICLGFVMIVQFMLESFDRSLGWDEYQSFEDRFIEGAEVNLVRNVFFSGVKLLCLGLVVAYGLYYEPSDKLNPIVGLLAIIVPTIWFLSYYGSELMSRHGENEIETEYSDDSFKKMRRFITMILLTSSLIMAYLYFGTWYVWLASVLNVIILFNSLLIEMVGEELQFDLLKKRIVALVLITPFFIGLVSEIVQFWAGINNFLDVIWTWSVNAVVAAWDFIGFVLTYRLNLLGSSASVWLLLIFVICIFLLLKIIAYHINRAEQDKCEALYEARIAEEEAEAKRLEAENEEIMRRNLIQIMCTLANDIPISKEYLFYLGKNLVFLKDFPISKLTAFDFKQLFKISDQKQKIVWEHDLKYILEMYDSFFKKAETSDRDLAAITAAIQKICIFVEEYKEYKSFDAFRRMLDEATPNIPSAWASVR